MFQSTHKILSLNLLKLQYRQLVNVHNLERLSYFRFWMIFKQENITNKTIYLHYVLNQWIKQNFILTIKFLNRFKRIVRKTRLTLSELELHNLNIWEEQIFSRMRHIKVLNVNFKLLNKETAYARFIHGELYHQLTNKLTTFLTGELLMTNFRLIIYNFSNHQNPNSQDLISLFYRDINQVNIYDYGLEIITSDRTFLLRIYDQITLAQTFINLVEKKVRWMNKKLFSYVPSLIF